MSGVGDGDGCPQNPLASSQNIVKGGQVGGELDAIHRAELSFLDDLGQNCNGSHGPEGGKEQEGGSRTELGRGDEKLMGSLSSTPSPLHNLTLRQSLKSPSPLPV